MGWETLANIGLGASTTHTLLFESFNLSQGSSSVVRFAHFTLFSQFFPCSRIFLFPPFLFFSFSSYVEFFSYSLPLLFRPSLDHFIQSHSFFHLSLLYSRLVSPFLHHVSFSAGFFFLAPLYPFLFLLFYFFFTFFFKGCSCSLSENLFV